MLPMQGMPMSCAGDEGVPVISRLDMACEVYVSYVAMRGGCFAIDSLSNAERWRRSGKAVVPHSASRYVLRRVAPSRQDPARLQR